MKLQFLAIPEGGAPELGITSKDYYALLHFTIFHSSGRPFRTSTTNCIFHLEHIHILLIPFNSSFYRSRVHWGCGGGRGRTQRGLKGKIRFNFF